MVDVQLVVTGVVVIALVFCVVMLASRVASTNATVAQMAKDMASHALAHDIHQRDMKRIQLETDREEILLRESRNVARGRASVTPDISSQPDYQATVDIMDN